MSFEDRSAEILAQEILAWFVTNQGMGWVGGEIDDATLDGSWDLRELAQALLARDASNKTR